MALVLAVLRATQQPGGAIKGAGAQNAADGGKMADFHWTPKRQKAAMILAQGYTQAEAAAQVGAGQRTIERWAADLEFSVEVDRLSLMVGIASRAERLRIAMQVVRQKVRDGEIKTDRDALDWLKFAQSETDGAKLDLAALLGAMESTETGGTENRKPAGRAHGGTR